MKAIFFTLFIFITGLCIAQSGVYSFKTTDFELIPNYKTGILTITNIPNDTLEIIVYNQVNKIYKEKRIIINQDTVQISTKSYKIDSYLFRINKNKDAIFRKYLMITP